MRKCSPKFAFSQDGFCRTSPLQHCRMRNIFIVFLLTESPNTPTILVCHQIFKFYNGRAYFKIILKYGLRLTQPKSRRGTATMDRDFVNAATTIMLLVSAVVAFWQREWLILAIACVVFIGVKLIQSSQDRREYRRMRYEESRARAAGRRRVRSRAISA